MYGQQNVKICDSNSVMWCSPWNYIFSYFVLKGSLLVTNLRLLNPVTPFTHILITQDSAFLLQNTERFMVIQIS